MQRLGWDPSMSINAPWNDETDWDDLHDKHEQFMCDAYKDEALQYILNQILDLWEVHPKYQCPCNIGGCGLATMQPKEYQRISDLVLAALDGSDNRVVSSILTSCGLGLEFDEWHTARKEALLDCY